MEFNIYAVTDIHQEARNLSKILTEICDLEQNNKENSFVFLDGGDIFKGIYDKSLSVEAYLKFKHMFPNASMIITLGNNDFGFKDDDYKYLLKVIKIFKDAGIDFVCGNLKGANIVPHYKIVKLCGIKILVTGFCMQTSVVHRFGLEFTDIKEAFASLINSVKESYDYIFVLNHHWYPYSLELKKSFPEIDLIIGGHEHSAIEPDYKNDVYYPLSFGRSFYKIVFDKGIKNISQINPSGVILPEFEKPLLKYENDTGLYKPIARRVLNLYKCYSEPCALGTFISDNMKSIAETDIAFHSTGFTMYPLNADDSDVITKYDFDKVICASTPIVKMNLNISQLKCVFENATKNRINKNNGNAKFLQCSQNISLTGGVFGDEYKIVQLSINGDNLLDKNCEPVDADRKFSCAVDEFIASGEQGFDVLKDIHRDYVQKDGHDVQLNSLLYYSLKQAEKLYPPKTEYPVFCLHDL